MYRILWFNSCLKTIKIIIFLSFTISSHSLLSSQWIWNFHCNEWKVQWFSQYSKKWPKSRNKNWMKKTHGLFSQFKIWLIDLFFRVPKEKREDKIFQRRFWFLVFAVHFYCFAIILYGIYGICFLRINLEYQWILALTTPVVNKVHTYSTISSGHPYTHFLCLVGTTIMLCAH